VITKSFLCLADWLNSGRFVVGPGRNRTCNRRIRKTASGPARHCVCNAFYKLAEEGRSFGEGLFGPNGPKFKHSLRGLLSLRGRRCPDPADVESFGSRHSKVADRSRCENTCSSTVLQDLQNKRNTSCQERVPQSSLRCKKRCCCGLENSSGMTKPRLSRNSRGCGRQWCWPNNHKAFRKS
jgi:hypothetical protein